MIDSVLASKRGPPRFEVADIFRRHGQTYRDRVGVTQRQLEVMQAIERCRTAALGGHVDRCDTCDYRNRSADHAF